MLRLGLLRRPVARSVLDRTSCLLATGSRHFSNIEGLVLARDLYNQNDKAQKEKTSFYDKSALEHNRDRDIYTMGHFQLRLVLEGENKQVERRLNGRTEKLQSIIGKEFVLLPKEAIVILCGLSNALIKFPQVNDSNIIHEASKLRDIGMNTYKITKETLLLFGDLQHLSAPWEELVTALKAVNDEKYIIPQFMKANVIYDLVIPFRGATKGVAHLLQSEPSTTGEIVELTERKQKIRDATSIGSFYTLIGLLVVKYGKEMVVERFLVPRVFNGNNGIIDIITSRIGER